MYPIPVARRVCYIRPMDGSLLTFLSLGFGLGLVHALALGTRALALVLAIPPATYLVSNP